MRRIEAKCPDQIERLFDDYDRQDILALNLTRTVQLCVDLAGRMRSAVGFRNVAIHNYRDLDWRIVHTICRERSGDFTAFAHAVADRLPPPDARS